MTVDPLNSWFSNINELIDEVLIIDSFKFKNCHYIIISKLYRFISVQNSENNFHY